MTDRERRTWTKAQLARIEELWQTGISMSRVGEAMGVNRNIIAGVIHRNRFQREASKPARPPAPRKNLVVLPPEPEIRRKPFKVRSWLRDFGDTKPDGEPVELLMLGPNGCRWPVGMRDGIHLHCNYPRRNGGPYCATHERASYGHK